MLLYRHVYSLYILQPFSGTGLDHPHYERCGSQFQNGSLWNPMDFFFTWSIWNYLWIFFFPPCLTQTGRRLLPKKANTHFFVRYGWWWNGSFLHVSCRKWRFPVLNNFTHRGCHMATPFLFVTHPLNMGTNIPKLTYLHTSLEKNKVTWVPSTMSHHHQPHGLETPTLVNLSPSYRNS